MMPEPAEKLHAFLQSAGFRGEWESRGSFTLAVEKAREKLAQCSFENPAFFVLKLVQAAVAMGARWMRLETSRRTLGLSFDAPAEPTLEVLLEALANPAMASPRSLALVAQGFNAGAAAGAIQASLLCWTNTSLAGYGIFFEQGELKLGVAPDLPAGAEIEEGLWMLTFRRRGGLFRTDLFGSERELVRARCRFSPVPIEIDGQPLRAAMPHPSAAKWLADYSEPFHLVERFRLGGGAQVEFDAKTPRSIGVHGALRRNRSMRAYSVQPADFADLGSLEIEAAYAISVALEGEDRVELLCHGVVVESITIQTRGAGAWALLEAGDLSYDVSGFSAVRDDRLEREFSQVRASWRQMLEEMGDDLAELSGTMESKAKPHAYAGCGCAVLGMLMAPVGLLFEQHLMLMASAATVFFGGTGYHQGWEDPTLEFREALTQRHQKLLQSQWPDAANPGSQPGPTSSLSLFERDFGGRR